MAAATLASLAQKLSHDILEVRERALHALTFKLNNGLLQCSDLGACEPCLRALLQWFNFDTGMGGAREVEVLAMLRRVVTEDPGSVKSLLALGADSFLRDLRGNRCASRRTLHHRLAASSPSNRLQHLSFAPPWHFIFKFILPSPQVVPKCARAALDLCLGALSWRHYH